MQFEKIASGFYLEALAVSDDVIWFTDVARGGLHRIDKDGRTQTWFADRPFIAALQLNHDGRIIYSGPHGIAWLDPETGVSGSLVHEINGKPVPGVNEMTPDGEGGLYFGTIDLVSIAKGEKPGPSTLNRLYADGRVVELCGGLAFSNGLGLSADKKRLYHNESFVGVFAYDVQSDERLGPAQKLMDKRDCDGMAMDTEGGIWICGFSSNELIRLLPDGRTETLALPGEASTNVRFTGAHGRTMYCHTVTREAAAALEAGAMPQKETSFLYRAETIIPGRLIEPTRFQLR